MAIRGTTFIETEDGTRLDHEDWGPGRPMVRFHGRTLDAGMCEHPAPAPAPAEAGYRVVALVGFSMGGGEIALCMSRHAGARVARTVPVSAATPCCSSPATIPPASTAASSRA